MEEESIQKTDSSVGYHHLEEPAKEGGPEKRHHGMSRGGQKGAAWPPWLLILLVVLLLASSITNLVVTHRAYESSRKQAMAVEQLTQSLKDIQSSIVNLSIMLEQSAAEEEEPEDERGAAGDGSI